MEHLELQNCEYSSLRFFFFNDFRMGRRFWAFFFGDTDTSKAVARSVQPVGQVHRVKREGLRAPDPKWQTLWFFFHPIAAWLNAPIFLKDFGNLKLTFISS